MRAARRFLSPSDDECVPLTSASAHASLFPLDPPPLAGMLRCVHQLLCSSMHLFRIGGLIVRLGHGTLLGLGHFNLCERANDERRAGRSDLDGYLCFPLGRRLPHPPAHPPADAPRACHRLRTRCPRDQVRRLLHAPRWHSARGRVYPGEVADSARDQGSAQGRVDLGSAPVPAGRTFRPHVRSCISLQRSGTRQGRPTRRG